MSSLDGERAWRDLANRLDDNSKSDYFRLNVPFSGEEPRLDDVERVEELRRSVHLQPDGPRDRTGIAFALLVTSFFLELDTIPKFEEGRYFCQGYIRCRNNPRSVIRSLNKLYGTHLEFTTSTVSLGLLSVNDVCGTCQLYQRRVRFYVRHLEETINMYLKANNLERRKLSGFPHDMAWFVSQQRLSMPFGNADHDIPGKFNCGACRAFNPHPIGSGYNRKRKSDQPLSPIGGSSKRARLTRGLRRSGRRQVGGRSDCGGK